MQGKRKKLNKKREEVQKRLKENPDIEQKEFDNLLDKMIKPESKRNSTIKQ